MTDTAQNDQALHRKRSKEELQTLAQKFVGAPGSEGARALPNRKLLIAGGIGGAVVVAIALFLMRPEPDQTPAAKQADADRIAQQAEAWKKKYEAERERTRQSLKSSYMDRIAQADSELLKDMQSRATALAARASEPTPAAAAPSTAPTPRTGTAPTPRTGTAAAPGTSVAPSGTATASAEPAKPAPSPDQQVAAAAPPTAAAKPASCKIHVSELSGSGKLTYEDIKKMKGARLVESTGHVFTPPVKTGSQTVVFEVLPTGCVNVVRSLRGG